MNHLNDQARLNLIRGHFEHRLMQIIVEFLAFRVDPLDAVPLSAEEEAAWVESLQGDWDIDAVDLEAIAQTNNRYVKPIGFSKFRWYHAFERIAKGELCLSEVPFHGASLRRQMGLHAP